MPARMPDVEPEGTPLPFSRWWPLLWGALTGVALRLIFSAEPGDALSAMSMGFIFAAPFIVGAVTVYCAERVERCSWVAYAVLGGLANALFVLGTLAVFLEGFICAILIVPLFAAVGAIGGLLMGCVCRLTQWPSSMYSIALLPVILLVIDSHTALPMSVREVRGSILIDAPRDRVWQLIQNVSDIRPEELDSAWAFRIGVPTPLSGTQTTLDVPLRRVTMGKHVYFDQIIDEKREQEFVRWRYRFYPDSFPPNALDDHVRIGGAYFDLLDTSYQLSDEGRQTRLSLTTHYRLSTRFNWYAGPLTQWMLNNAATTYLEFYRARSEAR